MSFVLLTQFNLLHRFTTIFALYYIKKLIQHVKECREKRNKTKKKLTHRENRRMNYFFYEHLYNKFEKREDRNGKK